MPTKVRRFAESPAPNPYIIGTRARGRAPSPRSERTQGLVALSGLRTLGFEKGRPAGARAAVESPQGLVALAGLRTLGFEKDRPAGARAAVKSPQGLVTLAGLRTLGFEKDRPAGARAAVESWLPL